MTVLIIVVGLIFYAALLTAFLYRISKLREEEPDEEDSESRCGTHCRCPGDGQKDP